MQNLVAGEISTERSILKVLTELMSGNSLPGVLEVFGSSTQGIIAISADHEVVGAQIPESKIEGVRALKELFGVSSGRYAFRENAKLDGLSGLSLAAKDLSEISKGTVKDTLDKIESMPAVSSVSEPRVVQVNKVGQGTQQGSQNVSPVARTEIKPQINVQPNKNVIIPRTTTQISEKAQKGQEALARLKQSMTGQHKAYVPSQPLTRIDPVDDRLPGDSSETTGEIDAKSIASGTPGAIKQRDTVPPASALSAPIAPVARPEPKSPISENGAIQGTQATTGPNKALPKSPSGPVPPLPKSPSGQILPLPNGNSPTPRPKGYTIETDPLQDEIVPPTTPARPVAKPVAAPIDDKFKSNRNTAYVGQNPFKTSSSLKALVAGEVGSSQEALSPPPVEQQALEESPAAAPKEKEKQESMQTTQTTPPKLGTPLGTVSKLSGTVTGNFGTRDQIAKELGKSGDSDANLPEPGPKLSSTARLKSTQSAKAFIQPAQHESVEFNKKGFDVKKKKVITPTGFYLSPGVIGAIGVCVLVFIGLGINFKLKADQKDAAVKVVFDTFNKHQYRETIKQADLTLRKFPDASELRTLKVDCYEKLHENDNALRTCELALKDHPNDPKILSKHVELCFSQGHRAQALPDLTKLLNDPAYRTADNYVKRGTAYKQTGKQELSLADYQTAASMQPDNGEVVSLVATTLMELKQPEKAYQTINQFLAKHPDNLDMLVARAYCHFVEKNLAKAKEDLNHSIKVKPNFDAYALLGDIALSENQLKVATNYYNKALQVDPSRSFLRFSLFQEYERQKEWVQAIRVANKIDADGEAYRVDRFYQRKALCEVQAGKADAAEADFEKAVDENPREMGLRRQSADCHEKAGAYRKAINDWDAIIASDPKSNWNYLKRGELLDKDNRIKLSEDDFEKAIELAPLCIDNYLRYAQVLAGHGDISRAKLIVDSGLRKDPKSTKAQELKVKLAHMRMAPAIGSLRDLADAPAPKAEDLSGKTAQQLTTQGYELLKKGENGRAVLYLAQAVRTDPSSVTARRYLAHAFMSTSDFANAAEQFEAVDKINPLSPSEKSKFAEALSHCGRVAESEAILRKLLADQPGNLDVRLQLVRLLTGESKTTEANDVCSQGLQFAKSPSDTATLKGMIKNMESGDNVETHKHPKFSG